MRCCAALEINMLSATCGTVESVALGMDRTASWQPCSARRLTLKCKLTGTPEVRPGAIVATDVLDLLTNT